MPIRIISICGSSEHNCLSWILQALLCKKPHEMKLWGLKDSVGNIASSLWDLPEHEHAFSVPWNLLTHNSLHFSPLRNFRLECRILCFTRLIYDLLKWHCYTLLIYSCLFYWCKALKCLADRWQGMFLRDKLSSPPCMRSALWLYRLSAPQGRDCSSEKYNPFSALGHKHFYLLII